MNVPNDYSGIADVSATTANGPHSEQDDAAGRERTASGSHLRQGDVKRKGADLLVAPLKLNVRLSKCGPRSVDRLRRLVKRRNYS